MKRNRTVYRKAAAGIFLRQDERGSDHFLLRPDLTLAVRSLNFILQNIPVN